MTQLKPDPDDTVDTKTAAAFLALTPARVRQLGHEGVFPKARRGQWQLVPLVQGYLKFLRDDARRSSKSASASRLQDVKTERLEMLMRLEARELCRTGDARHVIDVFSAAIQSKIMQAPAVFTRNIEERDRLEGILGRLLNEAADIAEAKLVKLENGEDVTK